MNQCKHLKKKISGKTVCNLNEKREVPKMCNGCAFKEFETPKCTKYQKNCAIQEKKSPKICSKSAKLRKLERNRESLFTDDLEHCIICGKSPVNLHEIFGGRNRSNSIKYKLVLPLCTCEHHNQIECKGIHFDKKLRDEWYKKGESKFIETFPNLDFKEIFKKNYL